MSYCRNSGVCGLILAALLYPNKPASAQAVVAVEPKLPVGAGAEASRVREELFLRVFKHAAPKLPVDSYVMVTIDDGARQKIRAILLPGDSDFMLEAKPVVAELSQALRPHIVRTLEQTVDSEGWLRRSAFESAGLSTSFSPRKFEVAIATLPEMREKQVRYLNAPPVNPYTVEAIRPAPVSAFFNFNLKGTDRTERIASFERDERYLGYSSDAAINIAGVVLEGSALGQTGGGDSFQRGDIRLIYDQPQRSLRYTAGDLRYPVVGFQTMVNMAGLGVAKDFTLQPHVRTYRTDRFEFYLERPAEVKVWVNESLVSTLRLPAGTHDIRGLAPAVGQNDTRLEIEDVAGRREVLHFSFIYNPTLLAEDISLFSYNIGFRRTLQYGTYRYDTGEPVATAAYVRGVSDVLNLGAYGQVDKSRALIGAKSLFAIGAGTVQLDTATSRSADASWDVGTRLDWSSVPTSMFGLQSQLAVEYRGKGFGALDAAPARTDMLSFFGALSMPLGWSTTALLSASYLPARVDTFVDAYSVAATLTRRWGRFTTTTLSFRNFRSIRGETDTDLLFGINVAFSMRRTQIYAAKELENDMFAARLDVGRSSYSTGPYAFVAPRAGPGQHEYLAGAGYWGNLGGIEASRTETENHVTTKFTRDETALRLQGALVFADSAVALARPVIENFAIVKGKEGLADADMRVDPDGRGGNRAQSSVIGPAVIVDLANYRLREVRVDPVNPPLGATPDRMTFSLAPTYKSGILLAVGREQQRVAIGRLVDAQGAPLAHVTLEIRRLDDRTKSLTTFTSRGGGFQLPDIAPGRYEIRAISNAQLQGVVIDIPKGTADGIYRLGDLVLR